MTLPLRAFAVVLAFSVRVTEVVWSFFTVSQAVADDVTVMLATFVVTLTGITKAAESVCTVLVDTANACGAATWETVMLRVKFPAVTLTIPLRAVALGFG